MALNANSFITVGEAISWANESTTSASISILFEGWCNLVADELESLTDRKLKSRTYTSVVFDGTGMQDYRLPEYPVSTVTTVVLEDESAINLTDTDYFRLYPWEGRMYLPARVWSRGHRNMTVTYTAGYVTATGGSYTVPLDLKQAALEIVALYYRNHKKGHFVPRISESFDGHSATWYSGEWSPHILATVNNYRRLDWGEDWH